MKAIRENLNPIKVHAICWTLYIAYEILVSGAISGKFSHFYYYFFFYALNISLFYFHALFVMPRSLHNLPFNLWKLPLLLLLEVSFYVGASILISEMLEILQARHSPFVFNKRVILGTLWRGGLFMLFSMGYYFLISYLANRKREMEKALEMERLKLELVSMERDFLRSQINPHLLFNTLNFIKHAAKHRPEESDEAIIRLSEIMSFAIERSVDGFIPLVDELRQIENMIRINQLRFAHRLHLRFQADVDDEKVVVLPIILLTLVENVFKHGNLHQASSPAMMILKSTADRLEFWTTNLVAENGFLPGNNPGLGISNIMLRLKNTYGDDFTLRHRREGNLYRTYLYIDLKVIQVLDHL